MNNYNKTYNILIVGSGNIGSRHLQSLAKLNLSFNILVLDNNFESISLAKRRFNSQKKIGDIKSINYFTKINEISSDIDLAIISTNADVRRSIIEKLFKKNKISNFILEKVCFQSVNDFNKIISLIKLNKAKAWVNLAKRDLPLYKFLLKNINKEKKIFVEISSGNYEIGCNTIHALDILSFLSKSKIKNLDMSLIENKIYESKRKDFIDFKGILKAYTFRGDELILTNLRNTMKPQFISVTLKNKFFLINTQMRTVDIYKRKNNIFKYSYREIYNDLNQSDMTHIIAKNILLKRKSTLPSLNESLDLHKPMLISFINHVNKINKQKNSMCHIT